MDFGLQLLGDNSGRVAVIYLTLIVLAVIALGGLALPRGVRRPRQISKWLSDSAAQKRSELESRAAEAQEVARFAQEIQVAADGAAATAERRREECQAAQAEVERAWQAWQDSDAALERARKAAAYAVPASVSAAESETDREQALRRAVQAAHRRGDISDEQLLDALTHRNGWDPSLHPVEQELMLARATVEHRFQAYQSALAAEDAAWQAADVATAAVRTLRNELTAAQATADAARQALPEAARAILDAAGPAPIVVTTQRIEIATPAARADELSGIGLGAAPATPAQARPVVPAQVRPAAAGLYRSAAMDTAATIRMTTAASAGERPSWTQPTGARPRIAGAR
ncbi:coiled-coil domain-containing protein [Actinoplanes sp. RD1]|uniref:hypothetical protein n=1 Tax=Actinoplanes sp. RD1 TaxID=3064538 RepID=UPI002741465A|nr:hypothetical protein [Actinoplanes sp. RD1]